MSKCNKPKPVSKKYKIRKDFVYEGNNVYEGEYLADVDPKKISGLIRRGFIEVIYDEPKQPENPTPPCPASTCLEQKIANSEDFEIQPKPTNRGRRTRKVDVSLKDQHLVDQADKIK